MNLLKGPIFVEYKVKSDVSSFRLSLLGAPRLERDAETLTIPRRKALALLAYLAVTGAPHSRETLATLLWPEYDQSSALANLRRELSRLKDGLGEQALTADRLQVELNPQAEFWLDVAAFQSQLKEGLGHAHTQDNLCSECVEALQNAVALYQSDFMAGFSLPDAPGFDEWQFFQAEELRRLLAVALRSLIEAHIFRGEYTQAIPYARRWLSLDSLHEPAHRRLMQLYAWSGQQSAALRQYEECRRILFEELGIQPEAETQALYEAIKTRQLAPSKLETAQAPYPPASVRIPSSRPTISQAIRFCTSPDGVRLAYAVVGEGPVLVKAANWLSHLEYDWNSPVWRHWLTGLASNRTLVRYDERGCGLSDWNVKDFSLDAWVMDLETVVESLGLERFPILGISQGASIAIAYAVRHPEKVSHLILYGGYARGRLHRDLTSKQREEMEVMLQLIKIGWGKEHPAFRQVFSTLFLPEGTPEQMHAFNELERITTTPEIAERIVRGFQAIDVRDQAKQLIQPTLVLHAKNELRIPFEEGRLMAALIPNARLVPLESKNHILLESEPAWQRFLDELNAFLAE
jgi:DNA-binding SARP family transcriptional activator/pimeloyl-ACP methyl ester carboxylesterase